MIVVACSGGRDSVALAHAAAQCWTRERLHLVYVHHGLHPAADAQAQCVLDLAQTLGVRAHVRRVVCARAGPLARGGVEAVARERRYAALCATAQALADATHGAAILTAHHAGDQAESVLLAALRGAGPVGLAGIAPERVLSDPADGASVTVRLLRPWVEQPSRALAEYAAHHRLRWVEDPTNHDMRRRRNALRHRVMPALAAAVADTSNTSDGPAGATTRVERAFARVAAWQRDAARDEQVWIAALTAAAVDALGALDRAVFRRLPDALQERVLMAFLARFGASLGRAARQDVLGHLRAPIGADDRGRPGVRQWRLQRQTSGTTLRDAAYRAADHTGPEGLDEALWLWVERDAAWVLPAAWVGRPRTAVRPALDALHRPGRCVGRAWLRLPLWARWHAVACGDPSAPLILRVPWTHAGPLAAWRERAGCDDLRVELAGGAAR